MSSFAGPYAVCIHQQEQLHTALQASCHCICCCCCCSLQGECLSITSLSAGLPVPASLVLAHFGQLRQPKPVQLQLTVDGQPAGKICSEDMLQLLGFHAREELAESVHVTTIFCVHVGVLYRSICHCCSRPCGRACQQACRYPASCCSLLVPSATFCAGCKESILYRL
jgi:hypothetical protein